MARLWVINLWSYEDRQRAMAWVESAPKGSRIECRRATRSLEQNARMWAMLGDVAAQKTIRGRQLDPDQWKCVFMKALSKEVELIPDLEGEWMPYWRSSKLSVREMGDLMEFMSAWGAENGVNWSKE